MVTQLKQMPPEMAVTVLNRDYYGKITGLTAGMLTLDGYGDAEIVLDGHQPFLELSAEQYERLLQWS